MAVAVSSAPSRGQTWRMRAALVVDLAIGIATLPGFSFVMAQLNALLDLITPGTEHEVTWWSVLLMSSITLVLVGAAVALLVRLALRGQTPGLAALGLRWADAQGRAAPRRLLAEPQLWCALLPALWVFLVIPDGAAQYFVTTIPIRDALVAVFDSIAPALLLGALAAMILLRRHPGRLVPRR